MEELTIPQWNDIDPYPFYQYMRQHQPISKDEQYNFWNVFRHQEVQQVLSDYANFSSSVLGGGAFGASMISSDPPRHRQLRSLVTQAFTPRTVSRQAERIGAIVAELLDKVAPTGKMDIVQDLAYPLPVMVIAEILGIPTEDRARFKIWSDAVVGTAEPGHYPTNPQMEMAQYFMEVIEQRRQQPQDDLISALLEAKLDGEQLTQLELLGFCFLLLVAGNETTTNLIGNAIYCFDEHPGVIEQLRAEPELIAGAIEEVLRYRAPVQYMMRIATNDVELSGTKIKAGERVFAFIGSANRDETIFPNPDVFDIRRDSKQHIAFGYGIHYCLGAPLARLEAKIALESVLQRLPELKRQREVHLRGMGDTIVFGFKSLPVTFAPQS
jgi:cytochrome P450